MNGKRIVAIGYIIAVSYTHLVPEINDGLITIKKIARIPGERAKIAVESYDDPVSYTHLVPVWQVSRVTVP